MSTNLKSLIDKLNNTCRISLEAAAALCLTQSHYNIEIEHWLLKLIENKQNDIYLLLTSLNINISQLQKELNQNLALLKTGNSHPPALSQRLIDLMRETVLISSLEFSDPAIRSAYLLLALFYQESWQRYANMLSSQFSHLSAEKLREHLTAIFKQSEESTSEPLAQTNHHTPALAQFTINLTELARQEKLDEALGREVEIHQIIDILLRRRQNNPILTGEPGVGKTAVVEGLAYRIARGNIPPALQHVEIHSLDLGLLQAGAGIRGEFENRLKAIIQEVKSAPHPIILFIDEAHTLISSGGQSGETDAANLLKPALARGELRTIAATTWAEYKKYFEKDAALTRRFQVVKINEPDVATATAMLRHTVPQLEKHHQLHITDEAVLAAVHLSHRYLSERLLPDKAVSVLDTACARVSICASTIPLSIQMLHENIRHIDAEMHLLTREYTQDDATKKRVKQLLVDKIQHNQSLGKLETQWKQEKKLMQAIHALKAKYPEKKPKSAQKLTLLLKNLHHIQGEQGLLYECVNAETVAGVIADWTGIPTGRMLSDELSHILNLENRLRARVMGQDHALNMISQRIQLSRANLSDPQKPIGVFLLVGPSGVGKTETALALAETLYGSTQSLTTINLSEFKEEHKVSLLMGSPPGYVGYGEGGILTEAVRRRPYSLVLLDEVEKAHTGVQDIFYQVFDKGVLRDSEGRDIDFKNTVIILTSNAASSIISQLCADPETMPSQEALLEAIRPELLKIFKPAFLGRVTLVPYFALDDEKLGQIADLQLSRIQQRVKENYQTTIQFDPAIRQHLITQCQHGETGARQIDHWLTQALLPVLASHFLNQLADKKISKTIKISLNDDYKIICT